MVKQSWRRFDEDGFKHTYGPIFKYASVHPCIVCGLIDGTPADHMKTVGRGGQDEDNCIPVCSKHNDRHEMGLTAWANKYDLSQEDIRDECRRITREWRRYHGRDGASGRNP